MLRKAIEIYKKKGYIYLLRKACRYIAAPLEYLYFKTFKHSKFAFNGQNFSYFYHWYNKTWRNERAVEVPIIWNIVKKYKRKRILEVGNVLSHYYPIRHEILDKYEKAPGVINLDVVDFKPAKKYDLIISISTLEHVGWDEKPKEPKKVYKLLRI
jgi:hypothetical protein